MDQMRIDGKYDDEWTVPLGQSVAGGWEAAIGSNPEPKRGEWEKDFSTNQNSRDCPKQGGATTYYEVMKFVLILLGVKLMAVHSY